VSPLSSLLTSIYGVWNAETTATTLATGAYSAWNAEGIVTSSQLQTGAYSAWNGEKIGTSLDSNILRVYTGDNLNDTSGNTQNATNVGGVTFTAGKFGNAFTFNGSNNISLPDNSLNSLTGDFTVSMWVKVQNTGYLQTLFSSLGTDGTNYYGFAIHNYGGTYTTIFNGTAAGVALNELSPNPYNTWYNLVVTRKAGTRTRIYYNGSLTRENSDTRNAVYYSGTNRVNIGAYGSTSYRVTNGTQIDAVTIWNKELNPSEVLSLYNNGTGAEYPYSSLTLPSIDDAVGSNVGTLMNGCVLTTAGKIGNAFTFDGVNDYVQLPIDSLNSLTGDFSFSCWVYLVGSTIDNVTHMLLSNSYAPTWYNNPGGFDIQVYNNQFSFNSYDKTNTYGGINYIDASSIIKRNQWQNYMVTKNGTTLNLYIDGNLVKTQTVTTVPSYYSTKTKPCFYGMLYDSTLRYSGTAGSKLDATTIWTRVLTSSEVSAIYNSASGNQYPFSTVTVGTANDSVSTNNGTLVGGVTYTTGIVGNAFSFNGTDAQIDLPNGAFNFTGDFSISLWVKFNSLSLSNVMFGNFYQSTSTLSTRTGYLLYQQSNKIRFATYANSTSIAQGSTTLATGTWYHIVVTKPSNGDPIVYLNGVAETITAVNAPISINPTYTSQNTARIGVQYIYSGYSDRLNGSIDTLTTWTKVVTADEVTQLYNIGGGIQYPFTTQTIKTPYAAYNGENLNDSVGTNNLTVGAGTVTYTTGKVANAFTLTAGQLNFPTNSMQFSGSFSYSMWIKYTGSVPQYNQIFTATGNQSRYGYYIYNYSGSLRVVFGDGSTAVGGDLRVVVNPSFTPTANTWYHIAVVFNSGSSAQVYVNGLLLSSVAHTMTSVLYDTTRPNPIIGNNPGTGTDGPMTGQVDGLTFWNSALTYPEVSALYNDGAGMEYPYSSSIVAKLPSASDAYGSNNGTLMNGCTFTTGKIGKAFLFDGVNDYVALPNNILKKTGDFSFSVWVNANVLSGNKAIFGTYFYDGTTYGWRLDFVNSGMNFGIFGSSQVNLGITGTFNTGQWYNIVVTRKASTGTKVYINGTLNVSNTSTINHNYATTQYTTIGATQYQPSTVTYYLNGKIDAVSVWDKELSAAEVTALYNSSAGKQYPNY